jgi:hypothetical protein
MHQMENDIVFKLLDSLVHTEKRIAWERTSISDMYRAKVTNYYIEIEKSTQYTTEYYLRVFDIDDSCKNLATYSTHGKTKNFHLFERIYKDAYNSVEQVDDKAINEIIEYLNS